ncbi:MAG: hypothetical protein EBX40_03850 [Gammaproteobacteria bacterium]|nr:hypothetical protein [Gammaproteobacteria bacterium]
MKEDLPDFLRHRTQAGRVVLMPSVSESTKVYRDLARQVAAYEKLWWGGRVWARWVKDPEIEAKRAAFYLIEAKQYAKFPSLEKDRRWMLQTGKSIPWVQNILKNISMFFEANPNVSKKSSPTAQKMTPAVVDLDSESASVSSGRRLSSSDRLALALAPEPMVSNQSEFKEPLLQTAQQQTKASGALPRLKKFDPNLYESGIYRVGAALRYARSQARALWLAYEKFSLGTVDESIAPWAAQLPEDETKRLVPETQNMLKAWLHGWIGSGRNLKESLAELRKSLNDQKLDSSFDDVLTGLLLLLPNTKNVSSRERELLLGEKCLSLTIRLVKCTARFIHQDRFSNLPENLQTVLLEFQKNWLSNNEEAFLQMVSSEPIDNSKDEELNNARRKQNLIKKFMNAVDVLHKSGIEQFAQEGIKRNDEAYWEAHKAGNSQALALILKESARQIGFVPYTPESIL